MEPRIDLHDNAEHRRLIDKMEKLERALAPALDERAAGEGLPEALGRAWAPVAAGDASLNDYAALSSALGLYADLFPEAVRSHIAAYRELVEELFEMDEGLDTPNVYDPLS